MEAMLDQLADRAVAIKAEARLGSLRSARKISLDEL